MKYYYFSDNINKDSVKQVLHFISSNQGNITIYFDSEGGEVNAANTLIEVINSNKERITLHVIGYIFSSAFMVFLKTKCKTVLNSNCLGMIHETYQSFSIKSSGKTGELDSFMIKENKKEHLRDILELKELGLNRKEIAKINKGKDVCFDNKRLREILLHTKKRSN